MVKTHYILSLDVSFASEICAVRRRRQDIEDSSDEVKCCFSNGKKCNISLRFVDKKDYHAF